MQAACPRFDAQAFTREVLADLPRLELKARIARTSEALRSHLPGTAPEAVDILLRSLPPTPEAAGITNGSGLHIYSPHSDFVARYCRRSEDLEHALTALARFTQYFTAEDTVRYFLRDFPEETLKAVDRWARDSDYRVRRLASESTRPRLPGSIRVPLGVDVALAVLDQLYADSSRYVTTSVANHMHDIAEEDLALVLDPLGRWAGEGQAQQRSFDFIARQALRSRLKKGDETAYEFLGFPSNPPVELSSIRLEHTQVRVGDTLAFSADLRATAAANLRVNYVISSPTKTAKRRVKAYVLKSTEVEAGQTVALSKRHSLRSTAGVTLMPAATHSNSRSMAAGSARRSSRSSRHDGAPSSRLVAVHLVHCSGRQSSAAVQQMLREFRASQVALYGHCDDPFDTPPEEFVPPHGLFLLARDPADQPLGCGGWHVLGPGTGEIKRMYVWTEERGHSLGRQILQLLEVDARRHGLDHMQLETGALNNAALALYARQGYTPIPAYRAGRGPSINRALRRAL
ncbi:GNAT family N-acetyltransferase [Streptomyces echinatus]|uniref:GNAT family N-acetyltransferase n=1 Tax=Streptomyces echinatus TaxID=67293 RepID=UPI0037A13159